MRFLAVVLLFSLLLVACADTPPPALAPEAAAERDSVLALLREVDAAAFDAAYARLAMVPEYQVSTRTVQVGVTGDTLASHSRTHLVLQRETRLVSADSSGTFDHGGFGSVAERRRDLPPFAISPAERVFPADPAYLDPRGREVFTFAFAGDTLVGGQRLRILTVTARPGEGDDQPLRSARLYLDEADALVGVRVRRRQASPLFSEHSTLVLFLQPTPDGWLPDRLSVDSKIHAPLTTPRHFLLDERYLLDADG